MLFSWSVFESFFDGTTKRLATPLFSPFFLPFSLSSRLWGSPSGSPAFPIVGIGASAGGLEAFTRLLGQLPVTTGMAYVVVQHLDPSQLSLLPGLLARVTQMPVREVQDGMTVEQDHIYVIPAHADTMLEDSVVKNLSSSKLKV